MTRKQHSSGASTTVLDYAEGGELNEGNQHGWKGGGKDGLLR